MTGRIVFQRSEGGGTWSVTGLTLLPNETVLGWVTRSLSQFHLQIARGTQISIVWEINDSELPELQG